MKPRGRPGRPKRRPENRADVDRKYRRGLEEQRRLRRGDSATTAHVGDIVLLNLEYADGSGSKLRPAVVVDCAEDALTVLPLSSVARHGNALTDWSECGLSRPSYMRSPRLVSSRSVLGRVGEVSNVDWQRILINVMRERRNLTPASPAPSRAASPTRQVGVGPGCRSAR